MERLDVLAVGLGPIGRGAAAIVLERPDLRLVGAVDPDPAKVGRDVAEWLGREPAGVRVEPSPDRILDRVRPHVALHCTGSRLPDVAPSIEALLRGGVNVVSSAEEMLVPDHAHPDLALRLAEAAREGGATAVGTGVNPGFVLDLLPAVLSAASRSVRRVRAARVVDAATRRGPLQRKVGAGLTVAEFRARAAAGTVGHVGMGESVALLGRALGLRLDAIAESLEEVVADRDRETPHVRVLRGHVAGVHHVATGVVEGEVRIALELTMAVGATDPHDEIEIEGEPQLRVRIAGGVPGDVATAAILVNTLPRVVEAAPGLVTVLDLPPARRGR
jgi:hypothetical protein